MLNHQAKIMLILYYIFYIAELMILLYFLSLPTQSILSINHFCMSFILVYLPYTLQGDLYYFQTDLSIIILPSILCIFTYISHFNAFDSFGKYINGVLPIKSVNTFGLLNFFLFEDYGCFFFNLL
jgi:hypothetical protein